MMNNGKLKNRGGQLTMDNGKLKIGQRKLPAGWEEKKLGELCEIELGKTPYRGNRSFWDTEKQTNNVWLSIADLLNTDGDIVSDSKEYITDAATKISKIVKTGTLLLSFKLTLGRLAFAGKDLFTNEAIAALTIKDEKEIDKYFLYQFLSFFDWNAATEGDIKVKGKTLNKAKLREIEIHFPKPLPEQKRIVGILDKAFDAVDKAKANAEKNLANARELFESYLQNVFENSGKDWEEKKLGEVCDVRDGTHDSPQYVPDGIPFVTQKNITENGLDITNTKRISLTDHENFYKRSNVSQGDIIISMIGANRGMACLVDNSTTFSIKNVGLVKANSKVNQDYLLYFLKSPKAKEYVSTYSKGGAQEFIGLTELRKFPVLFAPLKEQCKIVSKLDGLSAETKKLEAIYKKRIADLEELKKSILQKAFEGELTADTLIQLVSNTVSFPEKLTNINTTDLHAGILAISYKMHENNNKTANFGHVKAEKIAHMIEAFAGIDLGRLPVKDAAGPNDFRHLKKVEHRARKTNCFDFQRTAGGAYRVCKLRGFERLIDKTRTALGGYLTKVEHILDLMLPLNVQHAEIVATVFAAWNNLLLDGKQPTDEEIVYEARENWHPDKLKIERDKFFKTIEWMRKKNIIPNGKGKRVAEKAA